MTHLPLFPPLKPLLTLASLLLAGFAGPTSASILYNDFDTGTSTDVGPTFQQVTNGSGSGGVSDPATGSVQTGDWGSSTYGLNTANAVNLTDTPDATGFTLEWHVSAADIRDEDNAKYNGWFFGITNSTDASKDGLFNQASHSLGIILIANTIPDMSLYENADGSVATTDLGVGNPTVTSLEDGFTLSMTFREDNTWSVYSTGLSEDFTASGTAATADYATLSQNLVVNTSIQGANIGYTVEQVTLATVPEPTALALMASALAIVGLLHRCSGA